MMITTEPKLKKLPSLENDIYPITNRNASPEKNVEGNE